MQPLFMPRLVYSNTVDGYLAEFTSLKGGGKKYYQVMTVLSLEPVMPGLVLISGKSTCRIEYNSRLAISNIQSSRSREVIATTYEGN